MMHQRITIFALIFLLSMLGSPSVYSDVGNLIFPEPDPLNALSLPPLPLFRELFIAAAALCNTRISALRTIVLRMEPPPVHCRLS